MLTVRDKLTGPLSVTHPGGDLSDSVFTLSDLSSDSNAPGQLVIPVGFKGGCGMSVGDTDTFCAPRDRTPRSQKQGVRRRDRYVPIPFVEGARFGVISGPLGTYPPPHDLLKGGCPDTDGPLPIVPEDSLLGRQNIPFASKTVFEVYAYVQSTCDKNVLDGACVNENSISQEEYRFLLGLDKTLRDLGKIPADTPALLTPAYRLTKSGTCQRNHHGRTSAATSKSATCPCRSGRPS